MNRRIAVFLVVAAVVILASGCNRPMSTGPLPKPQGQPTAIGMPTLVPTTAAAAGAPTAAAGALQPTSPPGGAPAATSAPTPAPEATSAPAPAAAPTSEPTAAPMALTAPITYTVKPGDWVYNIARKFSVSPNSIIETNGLYPPYSLHVGQTLIIPAGGTPPGGGGNIYIVRPGDTLYSIARRTGKSVMAIASANNLISIHLIFVGQRLVIP